MDRAMLDVSFLWTLHRARCHNYYSRDSSALRGAIPLSLASITADERRREISIDSGAEVWHLKTRNAKDFEEWTRALEKASNTARGVAGEETSPETPRLKVRTSEAQNAFSSQEEREWEQVEVLVSRIVGTRDAIRRLTRDTAPAPASTSNRQSYAGLGIPGVGSPSPDENSDLFATASDKKSFWRRKSSAPSSPHLFPRMTSSQLATPTPTSVPTTISAIGSPSSPSSRKARHQGDASMHDHCTDLLSDLDAVLLDFSTLLANSKRRRLQTPISAVSRNSMDSTSTGEFYDAGNDARTAHRV